MFKSVVLSTMVYGSETWAPIATHIKCLQGFIMRCVRVVLEVTKWDKKRNTKLRVMACLQRVEVMLMRRQLWWLGRVAWMEETHIPKWMFMHT